MTPSDDSKKAHDEANDPPKESKTRPPRFSKKRKDILFILAVIFIIAGLLWGIYWLVWGRFNIYTDDAYVNGNLVSLMPQISGTVISIYTDDTQLVTEGQSLIKLDDSDTRVTLQRARANLAATVRQVRQYYENVQQAQAVVDARKADLERAQLDLKRRIGLVQDRAVSAEEWQHYKTTETTALAQYNNAVSRLGAALAIVEGTSLYQHPQVERAKTDFKHAYLNWVRTIIYSPVTGYVAQRSAQVGQQINPGTALLAVIDLTNTWVDANYKETQLERIRIDQPVTLIADKNDFNYHGRVAGLTPGTGSVFALLPPQNATGNWIKIVQRLAVRIALDPKEVKDHPLQLGLSMRVTVNTFNKKGKTLSLVVNQKPLYSTTIFQNQLAHAEQEINTTLKANAPNISFNTSLHKKERTHG